MKPGKLVYWHAVRWQCPICARFIADAAVESEDYFDPVEHLVVCCRTWGTCTKCGRVEEPRIRPISGHRIREAR